MSTEPGDTMSNALARFRIIALAEGTSFLVLLLIAMPMKYALEMPMINKVVGWIHGVLFILYVVMGLHAAIDEEWSPGFMLVAFVASLVPGGTFWLDRKLRPEQPAQAE
jgi:integral membrane protein